MPVPARKRDWRSLGGQLDERGRRESDINWWYVEEPAPGRNNFWARSPFSGERAVVGSALGKITFKPGSVVAVGSQSGDRERSILGLPPPGRGGSSEFAFPQSVAADRDLHRVTRMEPEIVPQGSVELIVTLFGYGLLEDPLDVFTAVRRIAGTTDQWEPDPLFTLGLPVWVSAKEVEIPVTVSDEAPVDHPINIGVERA